MHHTTSLHSSPSHRAPIDWLHQWREDLGLTQTCRQLREEYLPIYNAHTNILITLARLADFAKVLNASETPVFPSGKIRILTEVASQSQQDRSAFNIVPILRLYKLYPDLPLTIDTGVSLSRMLTGLGNFGDYDITFGTKIESVLVYPRTADKDPEVRIKVVWDHILNSKGFPLKKDINTWLQCVGLQGLRKGPGKISFDTI